MRVRPFFWFLLALSCAGVLIFAASLHTQSPAVMRVQLDRQPPDASGITTLKLRLTDSQGIPIEQAQVLPMARMTNMNMATDQIRVEPWVKETIWHNFIYTCRDRGRSVLALMLMVSNP